jgi:hypothetical protein
LGENGMADIFDPIRVACNAVLAGIDHLADKLMGEDPCKPCRSSTSSPLRPSLPFFPPPYALQKKSLVKPKITKLILTLDVLSCLHPAPLAVAFPKPPRCKTSTPWSVRGVSGITGWSGISSSGRILVSAGSDRDRPGVWKADPGLTGILFDVRWCLVRYGMAVGRRWTEWYCRRKSTLTLFPLQTEPCPAHTWSSCRLQLFQPGAQGSTWACC